MGHIKERFSVKKDFSFPAVHPGLEDDLGSGIELHLRAI